MKKVIAIVVTHNRHQLLVECINGLRGQTQPLDQILVINNGSSDYTGVWLDKQAIYRLTEPERFITHLIVDNRK